MEHKYLKPRTKNIKRRYILVLSVGFVVALCCLLVFVCIKGLMKNDTDLIAAGMQQTQSVEITETEVVVIPWETDGEKKPEVYTMEDYESLSPEQRKAFQEHLGAKVYDEWLKKTESTSTSLPWKKAGAKHPEDYTWAEYQALTDVQQQAFVANLGPHKLEAWLQRVYPKSDVPISGSSSSTNASSSSGSSNVTNKKPGDYTLAEFQALSAAEKKAFVDRLGNSGFQAWLTKAQGQKESQGQNTNLLQKIEYPWDKAGATQPGNYTLEEYEALTAAQQKAFQEKLGSSNFEAWQKKVMEKDYPWEKAGAKQPDNYTWEEYEALTDIQKKNFQKTLGARGFESWREKTFKLEEYPWEKEGAKQPVNYTWAEYKKLTADQQYAFQSYLGSANLEAWLKNLTSLPWDTAEAKRPDAYTLEEYKKLTEQQQLAFQVCLGAAGFTVWQEEAQRVPETNPWDKAGAKQPKDYTLAEYEALTAAQQMAFQKHMGFDAFEKWQTRPEPNPWDASGAKQPKDYTKAEYEGLTAAQQMAFQNHLGTAAFETWLKQYEEKPAANPWEATGAKQPKDYSLAEFEALSESQQMAFQNHLGTDAFEAWLKRYEDKPEANPWDIAGAKQPKDYSLAEFDALTEAQQMAFQNHLGSAAFDAWLNQNQGQSQTEANPWETPDAKQPADYSMEEFDALTVSQQMAFQSYLGTEGFEAWLNSVLPS